MPRKRKRQRIYQRPPLTEARILAWSDTYHSQSGQWPNRDSGRIHGAMDEIWRNVDAALKQGLRGLPGGYSLARLLADKRGVRHPLYSPRFKPEQILKWADAYRARTGDWPTALGGPIPEAPDETWQGVERALQSGHRGLPGGSSIAKLLAQNRGTRNIGDLPPLTHRQILGWADAHRARTAQWPNVNSGPVADAPGEVWINVDAVLRSGGRGLPGNSSLARLLGGGRRVRNPRNLGPLTLTNILSWADAHHRRGGKWPKHSSGAIPQMEGETWASVNQALRNGTRGLPGGSSLALLLEERRGAPYQPHLPRLTPAQIVAWADAHHRRTGQWPGQKSGRVVAAVDETWLAVDAALRSGLRGLPGGSSLSRLLARERGVPHRRGLPPLTRTQILAWADAYHRRTGHWPKRNSGPIPETTDETWNTVNKAMVNGRRGWPIGFSLAQLLHAERGVPNRHAR